MAIHTNLEATEQIRRKVLRAISFAFLFILTALAAFNIIYHAQYVFAALEGLFALFSVYVFIKCQKVICSDNTIYLYLLNISFLIILATAILPITDIVFLWGFFFPTICYLLLGQLRGFQLSLLHFSILGSVLTHRLLSEQVLAVEPVMINFVTCYLSIWCISHYFELSRAQAHSSLANLALTDTLTRTNNRLAFSKAFNNFSGGYLLMIDIDNFKSINDRYGHDVGDNVLILISETLKKEVHADRIFRIGGEEFCIWLSAKNIDMALATANQLRTAIMNIEFTIDDDPLTLSFSGGLVKHEEKCDESSLLKRADRLLYRAKEAGRNKVLHCSEAY